MHGHLNVKLVLYSKFTNIFPFFAANRIDQGCLPFFRVMDPFQSLLNPKDPFSEIFIQMRKVEIVRFIEINTFLELKP